ncbi:interleukin-10 receptor subunit alpha [Notolabrus celidotus]|uniref:interleukin-10 receptor subunit alpha n=1 Tax=Notolabrus celidotus TaxID=1203425 RepID=UPI00148FE361|nr:interleukin-10 receptor subunit alpha [Notolabrus celidotus]
MDISKKIPPLVFLVIYISYVSGLEIPHKPVVNIMDGEVIVFWNEPVDRPSNTKYNVEMLKYGLNWVMVESCRGITRNYCDLSSLVKDYTAGYKVRVELATGDGVSTWTAKTKFLPNKSNLSSPSFTMTATSSTLKLNIHPKPILRKLFPYGVIYTIYLEDTRDNKTTTAYLQDDVDEEERSTTFTSLHWGKEYCVSIKVEARGAESTSTVSRKQCLQLPEQEWFIIAASSLSIMGGLVVVAIMAAILHCYLRRPEKTPVALKSPVSGWLPLSAGEGTMEVVTDKGWFLSNYRTETKICGKVPETHVNLTEDSEEEDRRTSMDSGVSMESNSASNSEGSPPLRQEDSGCGSMGGSESSSSSQSDFSLKEERTNTDTETKREDSGVGLGCQLDSSSLDLDGQDSGSLQEVVSGGGYRSQSHSRVQIQVCDDTEEFKQTLPDLAEVVTGYRAAPQSCFCSGAGQCTWCHQQGHFGHEVIKQYRPVCIENGLPSSKCDFVDSYKKGITFLSYPNESQIDTVIIDDLEPTFTQLTDTFPLLKALTPLPLVESRQDFNMNNVSLSLSDLQLITY